ncbi:alpha/beta hydrolase [Nocardioides ultimimeridianus]
MTVLPDIVGGFEELPCRPAEVGTLGSDLRGVAATLQDVCAWADRGAAPAGWSGDAAEAAGHARTRFARRADVAHSALQRATVATTVFEDRLTVLRRRRGPLAFERHVLNQEIRRAQVDLHNGDFTGPTAVQEAAGLRSRAAHLTAAIEAWVRDLAEAQATYVAALRRIDTVAEARREARRSPLPQTGGLLRHLEAIGGDPATVAAWWRTLSVAQRQALIVAHPSIVGRTDGIPITGRDRANRAAIAARRSYLQQRSAAGTTTAAEQHALSNLDAVQAVIDDHRHDVDPVTGRGLLNVIEYSPAAYGGDGTSIVSLGNPDHAQHVATYTPGFTTDGGTLSDVGRIEDLRHAMHRHAHSVATVLYENYDAPSADEIHSFSDVLDPAKRHAALTDAIGVTNTADAEDGGRRLAGFLDGLDVTRDHRGADVTVIGHSYGSVVASYAAQDASPHGRTDLDAVVLLADPGAPGSNVHDLVGDSGIRVYVGADDHDPVSLIGSGPHGGPGTLGADPATATYGAQRIGEQTGPESIDGVMKFGNHGSSNYLGPGTPGLGNVAALATGGTPDVVPGRDADNYESLGDLAAHSLLNATPSSADNLVYDYGGKQLLHAATKLAGPIRLATEATPVGVGADALLSTLKGFLS